MIVKKIVLDIIVPMEIKKIKDYERYSLYQVYKIVDKKRVPLYKETFTDRVIKNIVSNDYILDEEVFK